MENYRTGMLVVLQVLISKWGTAVAIQIDDEPAAMKKNIPLRLRLRPMFIGGIPQKNVKPEWVGICINCYLLRKMLYIFSLNT